MKITLMIDDKKKTFTAPFIGGRRLRDAMAMSEEMEGKQIGVESLDKIVDFMVDIFGKQFTIDDLYDGIESKELIPFYQKCIQKITGNLQNKANQLAELSGKNA
ncbi:phage tail assembly chaperone G [Clostridium pasteurianum]|uniref:Phage protein n=1 Tax=Clostridium pasteurianum BC1 TaxID=86416 RepID=R4K8E6_CLOPA|nr:hypothetical protein [Clostridium pasteurianum]AGK96804.1 hypothetical protein Clopa_1904 [Clostridium pasteurianum BC1]